MERCPLSTSPLQRRLLVVSRPSLGPARSDGLTYSEPRLRQVTKFAAAINSAFLSDKIEVSARLKFAQLTDHASARQYLLDVRGCINFDLILADAAATRSVQREDTHPYWPVDMSASHLDLTIGPIRHIYIELTNPSPM